VSSPDEDEQVQKNQKKDQKSKGEEVLALRVNCKAKSVWVSSLNGGFKEILGKKT